MNKLLNFYFNLPHDRFLGMPSKIVNRLAAKTVKRILDRKVCNNFLKTQNNFETGINTETRDKEVIISLTSFPARISDVWIVIECLFRQTYKADRIILWLDNEKFTEDSLPQTLKNQIQKGLEIRLVEDMRSHTKYFYALQEFKNSYVITVDDDCYYPETIVENLLKINVDFPNSIASNRIHKLTFKNNVVLPYRNWYHNYNPAQMVNGYYLLTGVSGVLYPPNIFKKGLFDAMTFMEICKYADDIWLSVNAWHSHIHIASNNTFNKDLISISKTADVRLLNYNSKGSGNDDQLKAVLKHFKMEPLIKLDNNKGL